MKKLLSKTIYLILEAYHYSAKSFVKFLHLANNDQEKKEWENYLVKIILVASGFLIIFPGLLDGYSKYESLIVFTLIVNISFLIGGKLVSPKAPLN